MSELQTNLQTILQNIFSRLEKIERDMYGTPDHKHVREYHGNNKVVFPNDMGFSPNQVMYFVDGIEKIAKIENGEIVGEYIKSGRMGNREKGETHGEIVFEKKLDRKSKIVFQQNHTGVKNDIQQIKDAAKLIVGFND